MAESFFYDVFLSHSTQDTAAAREIAQKLRADGLRVALATELANHEQTEDALERSRVLVLCMSAHTFGREWPRLEAGTFRFRDPPNAERRFIPLRLDDALVEGSLAQFLSVDWREPAREAEYEKLLEACKPPRTEPTPEQQEARARLAHKVLSLGHMAPVQSVAYSPDGKFALSGSDDNTVRLWDLDDARCLRVLEGHAARVLSVAWSLAGNLAFSAALNGVMRVWDIG
ncbi:MAG: TIR domain-containing protein [Thermoanaerobaculia bacterium]|nr:TIR domain-containing protein [Thermoanaerobaculia bacterium]